MLAIYFAGHILFNAFTLLLEMIERGLVFLFSAWNKSE